MMIIHKLSIDLATREPPARIDAVQSDCGRNLALLLHTNGIPWPIPAEVTATVGYCRPDGTGGAYDTLADGSSAWSAEGNLLTISLAPQVLAIPGETALSVLLRSGEKAVSTFDMILQVQPGIPDRITKPDFGASLSPYPATEDALKDIGTRIMDGRIGSVVLLGDSITDGAGGTGYNGSYTDAPSTNATGYCWANAFKKFLEKRYGTTVTNMGIYGSSLFDQQPAAQEVLTKQDFVIWLTGTNDRNNPEAYKNALPGAIHALREQCAGLLVISGIPATNADERAHQVNMQKMDELIMTAAARTVPHFSMYQAFVHHCGTLGIDLCDCFADHVHPNDLGYCMMFTLLCQKLGLPLDPYTDYGSEGSWWTGTNNSTEEILLMDSTDDYLKTPHDAVGLDAGIVPLALMDNYDATARTTALSGRHITRASLDVRTPGTITFGVVDLNQVGLAAPTYLRTRTFNISSTGTVDFQLDMDIGDHQTLAVQTAADTGQLGFVVCPGDLFIWMSQDFAAGAYGSTLILHGKIYGI